MEMEKCNCYVFVLFKNVYTHGLNLIEIGHLIQTH